RYLVNSNMSLSSVFNLQTTTSCNKSSSSSSSKKERKSGDNVLVSVPTPNIYPYQTQALATIVIKGKLYLFGNKTVAYNPKENRWDAVGETRLTILGWEMVEDMNLKSYCVIDEVTYCYRT
ncbi:unnamed protein product, partial [Thlaspi arvense]